MIAWAFIFIIASFLLGAVPFGLLIARFTSGVDLRKTGSGNIGATNVARTLGMKKGLITLVLDMAKGLAPVLVAGWFFGLEPDGQLIQALAGLAAFLGHIYSPFLKFKGGKGVATALGVFLGLMPWAVLPAVVLFAAVTAVWGYVSLGSLTASLAAPVSAYLIGYPPVHAAMALVVGVFVFIRHRENIRRLLRGQESKFRRK